LSEFKCKQLHNYVERCLFENEEAQLRREQEAKIMMQVEQEKAM